MLQKQSTLQAESLPGKTKNTIEELLQNLEKVLIYGQR